MNLRFDTNGLIPAIVQHARSGEVLMLGYMNEEALRLSHESGLVTFWSRSRGEIWQKGATSGNTLRLVEIRQDCDSDALLVLAEPAGPTCHTGARSCFYRDLSAAPLDAPAVPGSIVARLADIIRQRGEQQDEGSYTAKLLRGGVDRIGKKIGEEAAEVIIGAKNGSPAELTYEMADLIYHSLVLLESQGVAPEDVWRELERRFHP
ncbi:bifunctional phosphoribosyl-AMP cyclohydrolase/phosphoribosyl-ATP diphosphatase HisIE [Oscillochloris sp. ZM17-4]|uniref:bifunctional phosphoribosyl-AMP cyclohydrolase/phosphoribosyl-ATP diphosphatase HisIE n=1 Tax=Oscillochloris sp. ZM17-4 TaxID=2866714 RepID=UPI001C73A167|nr:bifunctional phosphoribosyl-AMP cyclohydrolase/phosphoribosyl-ATP diphosphatase HisIE [Oscillochloris sp. ZM17-4]MBX0327517.1 bifunctional phosphoribosyl-AMP cyclohydrolase/phosphoribosyl-ATP diphosphatase HisIE [Oscillochloris sp. ZM17-4]